MDGFFGQMFSSKENRKPTLLYVFVVFTVYFKGFGWYRRSKSRNTQLLSDDLRPHGQFETSIAELAADQFGDSPPFSPFLSGKSG